MQIEMITEKLSNGTISYFQVYSKKIPLEFAPSTSGEFRGLPLPLPRLST